MFFDHFSNFIAAKMVVYDFSGNGYRQIILPLACQDAMVEQAVSTIAAFHLAQEAPQMREAAETAQQAILTRLYHQSLHLEPQRLFNMATWATILILLVGDTITGSKNYVHLLGLLSCLARSSVSVNSLSEGTRSFIAEQTRM
ncbi:cytochrome P450 [Purpureocillium lavendulum]|uniref:Cytochrome P450 n=1 Tax=Purpureocillium lavendulum TaxID=1247861 RepID=A0AB34FZ89_9HYPO|nr:cytochrome P450 [Purpureocillium lavendulum]